MLDLFNFGDRILFFFSVTIDILFSAIFKNFNDSLNDKRFLVVFVFMFLSLDGIIVFDSQPF